MLNSHGSLWAVLIGSQACRLKADGVTAAAQHRLRGLPPTAATALRDCEALATADKGSAGAYLRVPVASNKLDRHGLQRQLPTALEFVSDHLTQQHRVLLHCDAGIIKILIFTCWFETHWLADVWDRLLGNQQICDCCSFITGCTVVADADVHEVLWQLSS